MARKRRRSSRRSVLYAAGLVIFLALLAYAPFVAWWQSLAPTLRFFLLAATGLVLMAGIGLVFAVLICRKRERNTVWRLAMVGWQDNGRANAIAQTHSAISLSDIEREKLAAQVYKKMGYKVQHVGQMGDLRFGF